MTPEVQGMVDATGLRHLPEIMFDHLDQPLICAFVERWQLDTNSFHLPFGEISILLHDVSSILHIPSDGWITGDFGSWDDVNSSCAELFGMERSAFLKAHWSGGGVFIDSLIERCSAPDRSPTHQFRGYMLTLLGATLFVDKSGNRAWIYEYFPMFRPNRTRRMRPIGSASALSWEVRHENRGIDRLLSIRQALDQTNDMQPDWLPYGICPVSAYPRSTYYGWLRYLDIVEPYMPDRTLRQLGFIQEVR
ncbi:protein MAINTENANCE OF MERISTEMS-like [Beta vulgaris subsp. vulgaris]|uniref:protein MAINTENANCE OF MERISTEMS-like n=1 Tax=Beta vulgaris subsp. vulgaris TaxID=3555 RepID=UPI0025486445|nr:protein MAINTENANCE OF MERISTEMS-like [Beta vulgaris subsp. vulgaris]